MELPHSSPRQFHTYAPPLSHYPPFHQIDMVPPGSTSCESSFHRDHQATQPFHNGTPSFGGSCYLYHWQMPQIDYITDIQPNDGKNNQIFNQTNSIRMYHTRMT